MLFEDCYSDLTRKVLRLLMRGRERISKRENWYQGDFESPDGKAVCALGAMIGDTWFSRPSVVEMLAYSELTRGAKKRGFECVADFNDDEGTKHEDVLCLYDEAIEEQQAKIAA